MPGLWHCSIWVFLWDLWRYLALGYQKQGFYCYHTLRLLYRLNYLNAIESRAPLLKIRPEFDIGIAVVTWLRFLFMDTKFSQLLAHFALKHMFSWVDMTDSEIKHSTVYSSIITLNTSSQVIWSAPWYMFYMFVCLFVCLFRSPLDVKSIFPGLYG